MANGWMKNAMNKSGGKAKFGAKPPAVPSGASGAKRPPGKFKMGSLPKGALKPPTVAGKIGSQMLDNF